MKARLFLLALVLLALATPIFAQTTGAAAKGGTNWVAITSGFAMAIASGLCGLGQAKAAAGACEGIGRNPGAAPAIRFALLISLVLIESMALYTLVIIIIKVV